MKNKCDGISLSAGEAEGSGDFADGIAELLECIEATRVCLSELIENTCRFLGHYTETMKETDCMAAGMVKEIDKSPDGTITREG